MSCIRGLSPPRRKRQRSEADWLDDPFESQAQVAHTSLHSAAFYDSLVGPWRSSIVEQVKLTVLNGLLLRRRDREYTWKKQIQRYATSYLQGSCRSPISELALLDLAALSDRIAFLVLVALCTFFLDDFLFCLYFELCQTCLPFHRPISDCKRSFAKLLFVVVRVPCSHDNVRSQAAWLPTDH